jgi:hypothetical protein
MEAEVGSHVDSGTPCFLDYRNSYFMNYIQVPALSPSSQQSLSHSVTGSGVSGPEMVSGHTHRSCDHGYLKCSRTRAQELYLT